MKGYILWLLILFCFASAFYFFFDTPSYVLISFKSYTIETTLLSFMLCFAVLFVALYIIKSILLFFLRTIPNYCNILTTSKKQVLNRFNQGAIYTFLGEWQTAYKNFAYIANTKEKNFISIASTAILASRTKKYITAKKLLAENQKYYTNNKHQDVVNMILSRIFVTQEQYKQAQAILIQLNQKYPCNQLILPMLITTLTYFKDWKVLLELMPDIKKIELLSAAKYNELEFKAVSGTFDKIISYVNDNQGMHQDTLLGKLNYNWKQLSANYKKNPIYIGVYVKSLIKINCNEIAIEIIEKHLNAGIYNLYLISLYSNLKVDDKALQLKILQNLEYKLKDNYKLTFFLGRVYLKNKLLGKAHACFEKSIRLQKNALAYKGIADICLLENKPNQAIKYFNQAFSLIEEQKTYKYTQLTSNN